MPRLIITVHFHEARYHGQPDWPPSPGRLFQALLAAAARGDALSEEDQSALAWLESLAPPLIAAPSGRKGQGFRNFVPNNDLDAVGGDPARISKIRAPKPIRPVLIAADTPMLYVWSFGSEPDAFRHAQQLRSISARLYQLGRGVDMAWSCADILHDDTSDEAAETRDHRHYRPSKQGGDIVLDVPTPGSLASLVRRHTAMRSRFHTLYEAPVDRKGAKRSVATGQVFVQPPKPLFQRIAYASPPQYLLFDISGQAPWPLDRVVQLTERVRDAAAERLEAQLPEQSAVVHRTIVGDRDSTEADKAARVRITPLPSIGHAHADQMVRRILVEVPPDCPLRIDDVAWAFAVPLDVSEDGEILSELVAAEDRSMVGHYGLRQDGAEPARLWRTVTPAALPQQAARRRIDPNHRHADAKPGSELLAEEHRAALATHQALRHVGIIARPMAVRVQREPFDAHGARAEAFAPGTRFAKERLWHVELSFDQAVPGPIVLGNGRYLGLGLMRPFWRGIMAFALHGDILLPNSAAEELLHATRRALMALSRDEEGKVPRLYSGHEPDGAPARTGQHRHIFLACADLNGDGCIDQLLVAAPWTCDRSVRPHNGDRGTFESVAASLAAVRAGRLGIILVEPTEPAPRLIGPATVWRSHTAYLPTRHARRGEDAAISLPADVALECARRDLPKPDITVLEAATGPRGGLAARLLLRFPASLPGPILLGRDSHSGGGLFEAIG